MKKSLIIVHTANNIINIISLCSSHKRNNLFPTIVQGSFCWNKVGNLRVIPALGCFAVPWSTSCSLLAATSLPQPVLEGQAAPSCSHFPFASVGCGNGP